MEDLKSLGLNPIEQEEAKNINGGISINNSPFDIICCNSNIPPEPVLGDGPLNIWDPRYKFFGF